MTATANTPVSLSKLITSFTKSIHLAQSLAEDSILKKITDHMAIDIRQRSKRFSFARGFSVDKSTFHSIINMAIQEVEIDFNMLVTSTIVENNSVVDIIGKLVTDGDNTDKAGITAIKVKFGRAVLPNGIIKVLETIETNPPPNN